jgi:hypothetical protein
MQFQETNQKADWSDWYWSTTNMPSLTYQSGTGSVIRSNFANTWALPNSQDTNSKAINDNWPVFGFANGLGTIGNALVSTLYSLGLCQQEAINFNGASGVVSQPSLWTSYFSSDLDAVCTILENYRISTYSNFSGCLSSTMTGPLKSASSINK